MQAKIVSVTAALLVLIPLVAGGYLSPYALSAHPVVVPSPVIVKAPIATSYQTFTKVDRPALVAYSPAIVKAPLAYPAYVKPALHYPAPLPLGYPGYPGYHGYPGYPGYGYGYHDYLY